MAERNNPEVQRAIAHVRERKMVVPSKIVERARERGEIGAGSTQSCSFDARRRIHHRVFMISQELSDAYLEALVDMLVSGVRPRARGGLLGNG